MSDDAKIVALGPREEIVGLATIGVTPVPVESAEEFGEALAAQSADPAVRIILVSETVANDAQEQIGALRRPDAPVVLLIPSHRGSAGLAPAWMKHGMEQSIGVDMITRK